MAQRNIPLVEPPPRPDYPAYREQKAETAAPLDHWQLIWESRRAILRFALRATLVFVAIAFLIPPGYDSVSRLMPPDNQSSSMMSMLTALSGKGDSLASYAGNLLGVKSSGALFIGVLHSTTVQDALIRRFDLRKVYWVKRWEDARKELESRSTFTEDRKSGIIEIRVRDRSARRAREMADAYVQELNRAVATTSTSAARREREFLGTRLKAVQVELDKAAVEFSQFASKNTAIDIPEQGKAMVEAAARLQGELIAAQAQRQGLEQIYTANNIHVRSLDGQIRELRDQLNKLGGAGVDSSGPSAVDSSSGDDLYPSIRKLPLLGVTYADLYRRTKIQSTVFETLTREYELAKVQEAKEIPTVSVLDPSSYPERRSSPPRVIIIVFGFLLSLVAAAAWIVWRKKWYDSDPDDPRKILSMKVWSELQQDTGALRRRAGKFFSRSKPAVAEQEPSYMKSEKV